MFLMAFLEVIERESILKIVCRTIFYLLGCFSVLLWW